jgi:phosphoglycolate phosphatase-like HAD superfamily hydrolase
MPKDLNIKLIKNMPENSKIESRRQMYQGKHQKEVFKIVYDINDWSSSESKSGHGSTLINTETARLTLPSIFKKYNIKRVLDVACGDFNWMKEVVNSLEYYRGTDIVQELIDRNNEKYRAEGKVEFECNDIIDKFKHDGQFDAIIAKDVLVHFPTEKVIETLENFKKSGIKYIFLTHFDEININVNIESFGLWRPLNFTLKPFEFKKPLETMKEKEEYLFMNNKMRDKTLSLWKLND